MFSHASNSWIFAMKAYNYVAVGVDQSTGKPIPELAPPQPDAFHDALFKVFDIVKHANLQGRAVVQFASSKWNSWASQF